MEVPDGVEDSESERKTARITGGESQSKFLTYGYNKTIERR